jgi:hypothetical protein
MHTCSRKRVLDVEQGYTLSHSIEQCLNRVRVGVRGNFILDIMVEGRMIQGGKAKDHPCGH